MVEETANGDASAAVDLMNSQRGALADRMGVEFTHVAADRVVATLPVEGNTQPYGLLHGGASVVLAESVGSVLAMLRAGEGRVAVGVSINAVHHKAMRAGVVTGTATLLQAGRSIVSVDIRVTDESGALVCSSILTCALRDRPPGG